MIGSPGVDSTIVKMALISAFRPPSTRSNSLRSRRRRARSSSSFPPNQEDAHSIITPSKHTPKPFRFLKGTIAAGGPLRPFRLLRQDIQNLRRRYTSDWMTFNQLVFASAVYVFFTNLLPGITFASDLYVLTNKNWGTIEVVFSTGICGIIFSLYVGMTALKMFLHHIYCPDSLSLYGGKWYYPMCCPAPSLLESPSRSSARKTVAMHRPLLHTACIPQPS